MMKEYRLKHASEGLHATANNELRLRLITITIKD